MIIVMGTPGAGKSTVLNEIKKSRKEWELVNYGDMMLKIATEKGFVKARDELRMLSIAKQAEIQAAVGDQLSQMHGKVILDTHCSINTPDGYYPGLPYGLLQKLKVTALVLITAPEKEILKRRTSDATRVRDAQSAEALAEHVRLNEAMLAAYSVLSGAPVSIIFNSDGKLDKAVEQFEGLLNSLKV